ncbi:MAG: CDP-glucose 4,6-dehydratase [Clostridium sp.]|nr:CDP-glucose 4,6-dehydratase [Clostridium sp.]
MNLSEFYRGKRVLVTGNTGFKGAWLTRILTLLGAEVTGYSMDAPTDPAFYHILKLDETIRQVTGDIRDLEKLSETFRKVQPEIVLHLAAQPIVRESYRDPVGTYATNVMGTVNLLECVRMTESVSSVVNVTTDKVYLNREWEYGYRENERLDGFDPYSNSKSCSELVTASYRRSFFGEDQRNCAITTCRAGNVIGGGDFAKDRIIPDCVRAAMAGEQVILRNPYSIRPYQHVLDPLYVYLMLAMEQQLHPELAGSYNVGPDDSDCAETGVLADLFCGAWGEGMHWKNVCEDGPHEANFLKLDCAKLRRTFGWQPKLHLPEAVEMTVDWTKAWLAGEDMRAVTDAQIRQVLSF